MACNSCLSDLFWKKLCEPLINTVEIFTTNYNLYQNTHTNLNCPPYSKSTQISTFTRMPLLFISKKQFLEDSLSVRVPNCTIQLRKDPRNGGSPRHWATEVEMLNSHLYNTKLEGVAVELKLLPFRHGPSLPEQLWHFPAWEMLQLPAPSLVDSCWEKSQQKCK